jgi:DNA-binding transcriptional MerR regulator/methylmalonyl-CoA mutase cobalamin-binding subunit
MNDAHHPIQLAARLTGLTPSVIRIWEQRYRAVQPRRTSGNRRLYSQQDIQRLSLLRDATRAGHSIGQVAQLPEATLRELAGAEAGVEAPPARPPTPLPAAETLRDECLAAIQTLDTRSLDQALRRGATTLGAQGLLQRLVAPLAQSLGECWRDGRITAAQEHFATGRLRAFLAEVARPFGGMEGAPALVVATPAGQLHEVGALLVSAWATNLGWQVTHLGASLPAVEIAGGAQQKRARAVALSLVYPDDDPRLGRELKLLRETLPAETALLAGGRAAPAYRAVLEPLGVLLMEDLPHLGDTLDRLRRPAGEEKP